MNTCHLPMHSGTKIQTQLKLIFSFIWYVLLVRIGTKNLSFAHAHFKNELENVLRVFGVKATSTPIFLFPESYFQQLDTIFSQFKFFIAFFSWKGMLSIPYFYLDFHTSNWSAWFPVFHRCCNLKCALKSKNTEISVQVNQWAVFCLISKGI